ncbi:mitochondrial carrier protein, putative [Ichthyophthirius multifiliis]|uniref:Mitochondrial carrier protein, putative n=1 Tax=Ichthyophthirius multifiliis TaxID=5932 RepID=G0R3U0_ICHMU|nr:mitochondrial carrier protein, putative [Ichthyophthirius multifiliis]EGR27872.1 mitochondrial carrier protein, putative [Ichthyophthirius multifiliis]|eukprot:XP_004027217.1 mitochondrial carrier protein, putative [Ichthyophthirius multifiliis]
MNYNQNIEFQQIIIDFFSGLTGGVISVTACAPLDIIRTRLNMMNSENSKIKYTGFIDAFKKIKKLEGLKGFFKGYNATIVSVPLFHSLFFTSYNYLKSQINQIYGNQNLALQHLVSSIISGLICDIITNPLWVVKTRIQVQYMHQNQNHYNKGVLNTLIKIKNEEGIFALYKGLGASIIGLSHVAVYFPIYEYIKQLIQTQKNCQQLNFFDIFLASVSSKTIACCITYPHIVIRTRIINFLLDYNSLQNDSLQMNSHVMSIIKDLTAGSVAGLAICLSGHPFDTIKVRLQMEKNQTFSKCIISMYKQEGLFSYYKGMESPLVTVPLVNAFVFGSYELYKKLMHVENEDKFTFLNGLFAGFFTGFANCILIGPIELAKCRLQMQKNEKIHKGPFELFYKIYKKEGIKGIYRGTVATQFREIPCYGAQFASYEFFKGICIKYINEGKDITHLQTFIGGGFGGIMGWVASYPQDIIKTTLQCETGKIQELDGGFSRVGKQIWQNEGFFGFWRGFSACLTRAFYANAIGFLAYENAKSYLQQDIDDKIEKLNQF